MLQHERNRLNRNEELLQMLEKVQTKATAMASHTEKLKRLKVKIVKRFRHCARFFAHILPTTSFHLFDTPQSVSVFYERIPFTSFEIQVFRIKHFIFELKIIRSPSKVQLGSLQNHFEQNSWN